MLPFLASSGLGNSSNLPDAFLPVPTPLESFVASSELLVVFPSYNRNWGKQSSEYDLWRSPSMLCCFLCLMFGNLVTGLHVVLNTSRLAVFPNGERSWTFDGFLKLALMCSVGKVCPWFPPSWAVFGGTFKCDCKSAVFSVTWAISAAASSQNFAVCFSNRQSALSDPNSWTFFLLVFRAGDSLNWMFDATEKVVGLNRKVFPL